ncbi:MAG: D-alanine--D-alanine ligase family protein [Acutalibacteraceae bacterium]|jgi:D-alanine-D-alanine ligase
MKTKVGVMFGGRSVEHEVSIISGLQAFAALDRDKYDPVPIYITKDNRFFTGASMGNIETFKTADPLAEATRVLPVSADGGVELIRYPGKRFGSNLVERIDVVVPVVHGTNVEDGTLMGMLEMLGVPYAGCDLTSSALGMDKFHMKSVLRQAGLPVLPALAFSGKEYALDPDGALQKIEGEIGYPVIVKPVNLGSSVGISKAGDRDALQTALDTAFGYASRVLVEKAVAHLREINCAVLGDADEAIASVCEEPIGSDEILSYKDKYMSGGKSADKTGEGMSSLKRRCPADIPDELRDTVQDLAVRTFRALGCAGVSRIDFLNDRESGELYVNEINTIPGSLSFYLWEAAGLPFDQLMDRLVELAFKRQRQRDALTFSYDVNLLDSVSLGGAKGAKDKA